jgi:mannose/fructose/N-acetylgalactosamine-specific phosphotransferase system component IID
MGVVVAMLIGVLAVVGTYYPFFWGYKGGIGIVEQIRSSQLLEKFVLGAKVVAMTVAGVMVASLISLSTRSCCSRLKPKAAAWHSGRPGFHSAQGAAAGFAVPGLLPAEEESLAHPGYADPDGDDGGFEGPRLDSLIPNFIC